MSPLRDKATRAIRWSGVSQVGRQLLQFAALAVLARFVRPSDFGLVGMATVFVGLVAVFRDLGTAAAVVQRKEVTRRFLSTIFWTNVGFGLLATLVLFLMAPLIGDFYHQPQVTAVLRALSVAFFISALGVLQQSVMERQLQMRRLAALEVSSVAVGSAVAVIAAVLGWGVWSLVVQSLVTAASSTALLWFATDWFPGWQFSSSELRTTLRFSLSLTGFNVANYGVRNADNLLVGRYLGSQALGYYSLAYRIILFPVASISSVVSRVAFPVYSRIQDDLERFRRGYLLTARAIALVSFPLMLGLVALREPFVLAVFGDRWRPMTLLLAILAPVGMIQSVETTVGSIFMATGRTDWQLGWGLFAGPVTVVGFIVGLRWGVYGVAGAYAIVSAVLLYPSFAIPFRLIHLRFRDLVSALRTITLASSAMCLGLIGVEAILPGGMAPWLVLAMLVPLGGALYLGVLRIVDVAPMREVLVAMRTRADTVNGDPLGGENVH